MALAVASTDAAAAMTRIEQHLSPGLDPEARARAAQAVDFDAAEAECPACGARFATELRRCSDCGLNFGD